METPARLCLADFRTRLLPRTASAGTPEKSLVRISVGNFVGIAQNRTEKPMLLYVDGELSIATLQRLERLHHLELQPEKLDAVVAIDVGGILAEMMQGFLSGTLPRFRLPEAPEARSLAASRPPSLLRH
jgi:hypothetical protein